MTLSDQLCLFCGEPSQNDHGAACQCTGGVKLCEAHAGCRLAMVTMVTARLKKSKKEVVVDSSTGRAPGESDSSHC